MRLRAEGPNHVWSYDFVEDRTHDGRKFRMLCVIDEFTHEALVIRVKRKLNSIDVLETLADLMILRGAVRLCSPDNGPELIAQTLRDWIATVGSKATYIEPGSPWENGYCESFNSSSATSCSMARILQPSRGSGPDRSMAAPETIVPRSGGACDGQAHQLA